MGVGGKFWDLLKPYARHEGPDFLRDKRVAVDLSYWIVQHETAIKSYARNPHLRLTFFRTINLFSKFGAFPVFVVDGTPSPLKSRARIARFFRFSGVDVSSLAAAEEGVPPERNRAFMKCVQECVELLELFGMPVLHAKGEAEAFCAQLNSEGHVDACITADSDALLFGAKCVIKCLKPNTKEPFECYHMLDIETGLGLKRKQLVAISLLVGNDHDLNGVQGIGIETALRFVQSFTEDEILDRLHEAGNGNAPALQGCSKTIDNFELSPGDSPVRTRSKALHCSFCGHPGSKRVHLKSSCKLCGMNGNLGCQRKPEGFKCGCFSCDKDRKEKEMQKHENWNIKVCDKIAKELNFPNDAIINVYLSDSHGNFSADDGPALSWGSPNTDMLVDFLAFHQHWEPSYIRQRMIPMLSTIFLREMAAAPDKKLLHDQYEFDSIQRVKIRYGQQSYVVKWKKAAPLVDSAAHPNPVEKSDKLLEDVVEVDEASDDHLDEDGATQIHVEDGFLLTDENMDLVHGAFPDEVDRFLHEKEIKDSKRRKCSTLRSDGSTKKSESSMSKGIQLNITEFYRSSKSQARQGEDAATNSENQDEPALKEKRKIPNSPLPKSVRRRLLLS